MKTIERFIMIRHVYSVMVPPTIISKALQSMSRYAVFPTLLILGIIAIEPTIALYIIAAVIGILIGFKLE